MKFTILRDDIRNIVNICEKIANKNQNIPILGNVFIEVINKKIKLITTNLEISVEVEIPIKTEIEGKITTPISFFSNLISNIPKNELITIESQNNNLIISSKNNSTLIKSQSIEDFPVLPKINQDNVFYIPNIDFISGLKSVWSACSLSDIKPEISSIYIYSNKGTQLTFTATDSFRLAERKFNYFFQNFGPLLIPFKTIIEIIRIFEGKDGKVKIYFNKNQINLELENIKLTSRIVDGVFPDYQQIIPKKFTTDVVINKDLFINSLKIANIFSNKLNEVDVLINKEDGVLTIKTSNNEVGDNISNIPAKITGDNIRAAFNYKYISDCLQNINSQEIILRFSGENKPLLISGVNDNLFQYLVMPMNI